MDASLNWGKADPQLRHRHPPARGNAQRWAFCRRARDDARDLDIDRARAWRADAGDGVGLGEAEAGRERRAAADEGFPPDLPPPCPLV